MKGKFANFHGGGGGILVSEVLLMKLAVEGEDEEDFLEFIHKRERLICEN